ncbi:hypothetical protein T02_12071 [Trichinella nativa]|uniref:Uncharacterized protein n=1 Tax=Trichinella nativa TaxID=6335 RepID=A0A0V1KMZ1_9BILA|nr:hypothetical protein T02_12071 [Trichinella nativa]
MNRQRSFCKAEKGNNILFMKIDLYLKTLTINTEKFLTFKVDVLNSSGAKALIKQDDQSQKSGYVY